MLPPLTLYIHIPWCLRKCPYCDFNSYPLHDSTIPEEQFIIALLNDLIHSLPLMCSRSFSSIFIGGGTPSLISGTGIAQLLAEIKLRCALHSNIEITIEINPGTIDATKLCAYKQAGINRLSIGIQSFNANLLKSIARIHSANEALQAVALAKDVGFNNINLDLMFGLPQQTVATAISDLEQAINLQPQHISWYQLTLETGTAFAKYPPSFPNETLLWKMQIHGQSLLAAYKFIQYEVSAYAGNGMQCQHNVNYWQFGDYLGIGPGAHSKLTQLNGQVNRMIRVANPIAYMNQFNTVDTDFMDLYNLSMEDLIVEFMLNALRLRDGFALSLFEERTGLKRSNIAVPLAHAAAKKLITIDKDWIKATDLGYRFLNQLLLEFFLLQKA